MTKLDKPYRLNLSVTEAIVQQDQRQCKVSHAAVLFLASKAGLEKPTLRSKPNAKGDPRTVLKLSCQTPKGTEFQLTQGDTHAIWEQHQEGEAAREIFSWIRDNGGGYVNVVGVEAEIGESSGSGNQALTPVAAMEEAPF